MMFKECCLPEDMNKFIFITIPKVSVTAKCEKHRMISHVTKLLLRVLMSIVGERTLQDIAAVQYGFISGRGTRNAIYVLRRLVERTIENQMDVYVCFIDYSKVSDTIKHEPLTLA